MDNTELFRKYVHDSCNNEPMVDAIVNLHKESGTDHDGNNLFAQMLYQLVPSIDLCQAICNIRDLVFDLGHTTEVDPSYNDAEVRDEPREKLATTYGIVPIKPVNYLAQSLAAAKQSYHDRVFNPINTQFRQPTEYERLEREIFNHR